jgi:hypothetical protein
MISDDFALQIMRAISTADRFGWSLHDLACAVWPDRERDPRQHSVLGAACAELLEQGMVISSGGRKARWALSPKGERHLANYRLSPAAPEPQTENPPYWATPEPRVKDPIELAIDEATAPPPPCPDWMTAEQYWGLGAEKGRRSVAMLWEACGGNRAMYDAAFAEVDRRQKAQIADCERRCREAGIDPSPVAIRARGSARDRMLRQGSAQPWQAAGF